ncbi:helix-turn-helix transcriptional regulator [Yersinia enterocolitica]
MATHDPIDLHDRSQAFHKEFFNHHLVGADPWYIKDAESCYVSASKAWYELISLPLDIMLAGKKRRDTFSLMFPLEQEMSLHERYVIESGNPIELLVINKFIEERSFTPLVFSIRKFSNDLTITNIIQPSNFDVDSYLLDSISTFCLIQSGKKVSIHNFIDSLSETNPLNIFTQREWDIGWLLLMGYTHKEISHHLDIKKGYVDNMVLKIYASLGSGVNRDIFRFLSISLNWGQFIPLVFINKPKIFKIHKNTVVLNSA